MSVPVSTFLDHSGGLVFGADGMLYYSASRWRDPVYMPEITDGEHLSEGVVWRLDPETLARDEVLVLDRPGYAAQYVSRGAIDRHGDLFFGHVGAKPVGLFRVAVPEDRKRQIAHVPMRMWG